MYAVTLSSALFLLEKYAAAVSAAAAGVILGWPFSILVFLPVTIYSLIRGPFRRVFLSGLLTSVCLLVSKAIISQFYVIKKVV
jgi:alpha-1,2-mannosyltransferase